MLEVSEADVEARLKRDNAWWDGQSATLDQVSKYKKRIYFSPFYSLATDTSIRRAAVLMGPRRVGKTVMLFQLVQELILEGVNPKNILYASIDAPIYSQMPLEKFINFFERNPRQFSSEDFYVLLDEVQYLAKWENHLKDLIDNYPNIKFIASGSAAAALRLASHESGAGRFSDFQLPPLTFAEYILFVDANDVINVSDHGRQKFSTVNINELNKLFLEYLSFGGYPEAVTSEKIRNNADQFVRNDIIDKVLLKDLPALYGITNIQELNRLFTHLAYNTGEEVSLKSISEKSGVTKPTISRYIEYLESAFLITKVSRLDANAKKFQRETNFKVYLNNPSMRAALFAEVDESDYALIGHLAESAIFSQWLHGSQIRELYYARWPQGEIDIVHLSGADLTPKWMVEVKWTDRAFDNPSSELKGLSHYLRTKKTGKALVTTRTKSGVKVLDGISVEFMPTSLYCYSVGANITKSAIASMLPEDC